MNIKLVTSVLTAALFALNTANAMPPKPAKCPDPSAIANVGFDVVEKDNQGTWVAGVMSNPFNTQDNWTFVVGKIKATSQSDARAKATASLKTLKFIQGPIAIEQYNVWGCAYGTAVGYPAVSITPAMGVSNASTLVE
jgi:hypothetical protein